MSTPWASAAYSSFRVYAFAMSCPAIGVSAPEPGMIWSSRMAPMLRPVPSRWSFATCQVGMAHLVREHRSKLIVVRLLEKTGGDVELTAAGVRGVDVRILHEPDLHLFSGIGWSIALISGSMTFLRRAAWAGSIWAVAWV